MCFCDSAPNSVLIALFWIKNKQTNKEKQTKKPQMTKKKNLKGKKKTNKKKRPVILTGEIQPQTHVLNSWYLCAGSH